MKTDSSVARHPVNTNDFNWTAARAHVDARSHGEQPDASNAAETKARRLVSAVASLRVVATVVVITMMIGAAWKERENVDGATAAAGAGSSAAVTRAAPEYFPDRYVNQARGAQDHVQNF